MATSMSVTDVWLPCYKTNKDPLLRNPYFASETYYTDLGIEGIPPTTDHGENKTESTEDEKQAIVLRLNGLTKESEHDLVSWIQECRSHNHTVDSNRLARFAICRNALTLLKHLVDVEQADLSCRDIQDRSVIFYALLNYPNDQIFTYMESKIPVRSEILAYQDKRYKLTALQIAVLLKRLDAIQFLLGLDLDIEVTDKWFVDPRNKRYLNIWYLELLFGFRDLVRMLPSFTSTRWNTHLGPGGPYYSRTSLIEQSRAAMIDEDTSLLWVHLPWPNAILFFFALRRYGRPVGPPMSVTEWLPSLFRESSEVPSFRYIDPVYESNFGSFSESSGKRAFIVFPCLVLWSRESQDKMRKSIDETREKIPSKSVKVMLQSERTLDEVYFPTLSAETMNTRNENQVVSRECTKKLDGKKTNKDTKPILMVPQLWLWRCDRYILTAFSIDKSPDLRKKVDSSYHDLRDMYDIAKFRRLENYTPSPGIQIGLFLAHHISKFGNPQVDAQFSPPLDIFEASILHISADVDVYMDLNTASSLDMKTEQEFLFRISDIREELAMIREVLRQQLEILQNFIYDFEHHNPDSQNFLNKPLPGGEVVDTKAMALWQKVKRSKDTLERYHKQVTKIDGNAERVEKKIQDQLNLKRTYTSIQDARASLKLNVIGLALSTSVIGFTLITIIFTPLAFITALFALPIDSLLQNQVQLNQAGNNTMGAYANSYVKTWFVITEIVTLVVTALLILLFLWWLGSTSGVNLSQGNNSEKTTTKRKPNDSAAEASTADATGSKPNHKHIGFRRRAVNLLRRQEEGTTS
ncbi:hypothetical protein F5Y12DRAFT_168793 [Xylaria sp. FL1777]|nr:hypothetical protein F5Y12DRAFT_168793 [Xylaria sp. FL1777]